MSKKPHVLTEEVVLSIARTHGSYTINPWRAPRQHKDLLDRLVKQKIMYRKWGRKHCVEYVVRAKENPA